MCEEFLAAVLAYVKALNDAAKGVDEKSGLAPYVNHVPVILEDCLCGFLVDEIGGTYQYEPATVTELAWWDARPWKK